jgi:lipopolysaccharide transport system ATP-binding protein
LRDTLAESTAGVWHGLRRRFGNGNGTANGTAKDDAFWALKDVSFEVQPGEVVGIIGRNGAGKSTLLKILSRIVEPTSGRCEVRGRMASLLEVGTGFHPELTGRENIYMNGSILGMSRQEITRKFDEIVAFSEIEQFLDTPVKRYSSGMYVRLAFAVAAHLDPEILVVDEVLAVGDASFQRRCMDRMRDLARAGRTVLLVSHNMQVLPRLCRSAILMDQGKVIMRDDAERTSQAYIRGLSENGRDSNLSNRRRTGDGRARFTWVDLVDSDGCHSPVHVCGNNLTVQMEVESQKDIPDVAFAVVIQTMSGMRIITSWSREVGFRIDLKKGTNRYQCRFHDVRLRPGHTVSLGLWMASQSGEIDSIDNAKTFDVVYSDMTEYLSPSNEQGVIVCEYAWTELL